MERITKAIERARGGRRTGISRRRQAIPTEITYKETRTAPLYPGWLRQNRIITPDDTPHSKARHVEAYKVLRTRVSQRMRQNGWSTLAITSPGQNEGKTLTAINLSISLAMEANHTVLLVDADLRRPTIHTYLGLEVGLGLSDHLLENTPFEQILVHPDLRRLVVVPGGTPIAESSETLSAPKMRRLVQELKTRYASRLVIFDLPPLLNMDDALAFVPYVDAVLLVIQEGQTLQEEAAQAVALLQSANANLLGTVLNKSVESTTRYGY